MASAVSFLPHVAAPGSGSLTQLVQVGLCAFSFVLRTSHAFLTVPSSCL